MEERYYEGENLVEAPENWPREEDYGPSPTPWAVTSESVVDAKGRKIFIPCLSNTFRGFISGNYDNMDLVVRAVNSFNNGEIQEGISELQRDIVAWADDVFPDRTPSSGFLKLFEEIGEVLCSPRDPLEWADVFIMLFDLAHHHGVDDLQTAIKLKMEQNRARKWTASETGTMQHTDTQMFELDTMVVGVPAVLLDGPFAGNITVAFGANDRTPVDEIAFPDEGGNVFIYSRVQGEDDGNRYTYRMSRVVE